MGENELERSKDALAEDFKRNVSDAGYQPLKSYGLIVGSMRG